MAPRAHAVLCDLCSRPSLWGFWMLIAAFKPGHDGTIAVIDDKKLVCCVESEKDSNARFARLTPSALVDVAQLIDAIPDVVAVGGWHKSSLPGVREVAAGYNGAHTVMSEPIRFMGKEVTYFTSSHERSHLMMALGMAPPTEAPLRSVLIWEGVFGAFYLIDERHEIVKQIEVLNEPGARYAFLYALADPTVADDGLRVPRLDDAGKLMALAAFATADDADADIGATVDGIVTCETVYNPLPKALFRDSPVYNSGVESAATKAAAALLTDRIYRLYARAAEQYLPAGTPLLINGGCGLNCDWNERWRCNDHFSSVFVPPCTSDSGSAIGTAIDAQCFLTGDPFIEWSVYSGLPFVSDSDPDPEIWARGPLDYAAVARAIAAGDIVAWVQGRWEAGPRALGNRSLLAEPFNPRTRVVLNEIKQREGYRPIAPCCRVEDLDSVFSESFEDPYMLYFRRLKSDRFRAITHVDGTARVQTVRREANPSLHDLLTAFAGIAGAGVLCNTSLNLKGRGFINRTSDLAAYCEAREIGHMVVGDVWYRRRSVPGTPSAA